MQKVKLSANNFTNKIKRQYGKLVTSSLVAIFLFVLNYIITDSLYLKCIFKSISGYDCPACGLQRAVVSLVHGDFVAAFWLNPYFAIIFPYIFALLFAKIFKREKLMAKLTKKWVIAIFAITTITWWILRNTLLLPYLI